MNSLVIKGTRSSPEVDFDCETGVLRLSGASYPENALAFYKPLMEWAKDFIATPDRSVELRIDLKYLNTSSTKCLMNLLRILDETQGAKKRVKVSWFYDQGNDTILEVAEEFMVGLGFEFTIRQK